MFKEWQDALPSEVHEANLTDEEKERAERLRAEFYKMLKEEAEQSGRKVTGIPDLDAEKFSR